MLLGRDQIKQIPWAQLLVQAALVVFSVLLALAMQSCREAQLNKELAQQALRNIASEIRVNQKEVEEALAYNLTLIDSLKQNPARGITWKPALIRDSAWETAQASGAAHYLDFSVISIVVEIHEIHENYKRLTTINVQIIYEANMRGTSLEGRTLSPFLSSVIDLTTLEHRLLEKYREALERIEA